MDHDVLADSISSPIANSECEVTTEAPGEASASPEPMTIPKSWRDLVTVHPAAEMFPEMLEADLLELGQDIKEHGLRVQIAFHKTEEHGLPVLLDGRNRLAAIELVHENPEDRAKVIKAALADAKPIETDDPEGYVLSVNIHRRHLTPKERRELVAKVLKCDPGRSNRSIAKLTGSDHKTIGSVRKAEEERGEIPHSETRKDAAGRDQPAHKPTKTKSLEQARARQSQHRDKVISAFSAQFRQEPRETLDEMTRILRDEKDRIEEFPLETRRQIADRFRQIADSICACPTVAPETPLGVTPQVPAPDGLASPQ